jgi:hypothetical protein
MGCEWKGEKSSSTEEAHRRSKVKPKENDDSSTDIPLSNLSPVTCGNKPNLEEL